MKLQPRSLAVALALSLAPAAAALAVGAGSADAPRASSYRTEPDRAIRIGANADQGFLRAPRAATNLLVNGSFEQNNGVSTFNGWSEFNDRIDPLFNPDTQEQIDAISDWWVQDGPFAPISDIEIPGPTNGRFAAVTEQNGPGLHILYQDVAIPAEGASLSCDIWAATGSEDWFAPNSFNFDEIDNQQARIDITTTGTVTGLGAAVRKTLFRTRPGDPAFIAPFTLRADLSDFAGQTIRLRFAEVDNQQVLLFGVDNCSITAGETSTERPPEPVLGQETEIVPGSVQPRVPTVQYLPDGRKAVVWMQDGGAGTIICIQIIDANDQAITTPLIVNASGVLNETPTVSLRPDGTFFVAWRQADGAAVRDGEGRVALAAAQGSSIVARGFDPNGTPVGDENVVSNGDAEDSNDPSAATDENGDTTVTWEDDGQVKGKVIGKNGNPKTGTLDISGALGPGANKPVVATSASGDIVACWRQTSGGTVGILCRVLEASGVPVTGFLQVDSALNARAPDVATDDFGNFIVVWDENGIDGRDIFGRRYQRDGTPEGPATILNEVTAGDQTRPRVSRSSSGDFVTVWQSDVVAAAANAVVAGASVVARGFNPAGAAETDEVVVAESDATSDPEVPDVNLNDKGKTTVTFERKKTNGDSGGIFRREVQLPAAPSVCVEDDSTLCLNGDRFRVTAEWENAAGTDRGVAKAVQLTNDTGYFYFFNPENVEVVIKAIDACAFAGNFWVFAAGLTDVEVTLVVQDTASGNTISYFNPVGPFQLIRDTEGFGGCPDGLRFDEPEQATRLSDALRAELEALAAADLDEWGRTRDQAGVGAAQCFSTATRLCVNQDRFSVEVDFRSNNAQGPAFKQQITDDTGYFYFFDSANVEVVIKVLDACAFANRFWVFGAGLTDVEVDIRVRNTENGAVRRYSNQLGQPFAPINDTDAFAACP